MANAIPSGWGLDTDNADAAVSRTDTAGKWDLDVVINAQTSIACVDLPHFSKERPIQGTKAARDSLIKLMTGMNNDISPLNFRSETERDQITLDPYHKVAPGWSTLSGGRKPYVQLAPTDFVEMASRAAHCVPMVRAVRVFVVDAQGNKSEVTVQELAAMNIKVQTVPNLYKQKAAASSGAGSSSGENSTSSLDVSHLIQKQAALESQLAVMQKLMEQVAATTAASMATAQPAPSVAAAHAPPPAPAAPAAAPAAVQIEDDEPVETVRAPRGGRARKRVRDE